MQVITSIKKKLPNGSWSEELQFGVAASNITYNDKKLTDVMGDISILQGNTLVDSIQQLSKQNIVFTKEITTEDS